MSCHVRLPLAVDALLSRPRSASGRVPRATIDFETRSVADLKKVGAWLYSRHPTTEILCLAYHVPGMKEVGLWHCAHPDIGIEESPPPAELFRWIESGGYIEAHNAAMEIYHWANICVPRFGWPAIQDDQWLCSAAKAAAMALPRSLGEAGRALGLATQKDKRGEELLKRYTKPKRLTKAEKKEHGPDAIIFNEDAEGLEALWEYCRQDVRAEIRLSEAIPDLTPHELQVWRTTHAMNTRGVLIDTELCHSALHLAERAKRKLNRRLFRLTGINAGTQRQQVRKWLCENEGLDLADTKSKTIEWYLTRYSGPMSKRAREVITILKEVNRTSVNKYKRMLESVDEDGRARELLVYCGAERTGRFAGRGVQFHNLPKGRFAPHLPKKLAMDIACEDIKSRNLEWCEAVHGDVMQLLVSCLRGAVIAPPGRDLIAADYSAIEARCVLWESGATAALEVFRRGEDIYCDMASAIFGRVITKATAQPINSMGATERDFGKVAVLGLGYGMGWLKFLLTLRTYNIYLTRAEVLKMMGAKRLRKYERIVKRKLYPEPDDFDTERKYKAAVREARVNIRKLTDEREDPKAILHELALCKYTVDTYRGRYPEVPEMWKAQEAAAIEAVRKPGKVVRCGVVQWRFSGRFLQCRLPSGRRLSYADPVIKPVRTSWGEVRPSLRFMGRDQKTKRWTLQATYGGKITENITQGIARDIMAAAKVRLEQAELYDLILSIHDEALNEVDEGVGDTEEVELIMSDLPRCYDGCPIAAEGTRFKRYRK